MDTRGLYVTYRMYSFNPDGTLSGLGRTYTNTALLILNKNQLLGGTGNLVSLYQGAFGLQPVTPQGGTPGNVMYMVDILGNTSIGIYSVTDPLGSRTVNSSSLTITDRGGGPNGQAPQSGSAILLDPIVRTLNNASLVRGDIWFCATRGQPGGPAVAAYWQVRLNGWPQLPFLHPTLQEEGTVGADTDWNFCPSIGANLAGDVAMTWTRSSSTRPGAMMVAWRTEYGSAFGAPIVVKANQTPNVDGRWGDFFSVWPDPSDGSLWAVSEWTRADTGTWSTWWAQISMPPRDFFVRWNAPNPGTQDGSLTYPYVTVGAAHANITSGTLHIFGGHYNEQLTLNKAVTLEAYSAGPVTIGAP